MKIGPYEVLGELGRGSMGVVYRVRAPDGREAALKLLLKAADRGGLARFEREKRLLSTLGLDEGFVGLLDSGTSSEAVWLLMPFVPGGTLRKRLEAGPLGVDETVALGIQLATALGAAHEHGIVHRDVKPENVLFTREGRPVLADLGLAKHFDRGALGASQSISLTRHGAVTGTVGYMAPEQLVDARSAGPPADVFALGAVLYECLTGRTAFQGDSMVELFERVRSGVLEPIGRTDAPRWLEAVLRQAVARDPLERFPDGGSFLRALRSQAGSRHTRPLVAGAGAGAIVLAGVVALLLGTAAPPSLDKLPKSAPPIAPVKPEPRPPVRLAPSLSARELYELGSEKVRTGDFEGAIADLTKAIELDPSITVAWGQRGVARAKIGDFVGATGDATKTIELDPKLALAWFNRGEARGERGDREGAIADETRAIELDPRLAEAWFYRGRTRGNNGDLDGAIADSTKAIELDPKHALAWADRGAARGRKADMDGAFADLTQAIALNATLAEAWHNRAAVRAAKGDLDGAIADCERFLEVAPDDPEAPGARSWLAEQRAKRPH